MMILDINNNKIFEDETCCLLALLCVLRISENLYDDLSQFYTIQRVN